MIRHGIANKSLARVGYEEIAPYPTRAITTITLSNGNVYNPPRSFPAFRWYAVEDWAKENVPKRDWSEFYRRFGAWVSTPKERIEHRQRRTA